MTPMNNMLRNSLKDIEAHITAALAQQPEDDAKCGQHLYDALVYAFNAADSACLKARGQWRPAPATVATGAEISAELRNAARSIRMRMCHDVPPPTMCGKPLDVYFDELADRVDAAHKSEGGNCAKLREALKECLLYIACAESVGIGTITLNGKVKLDPKKIIKSAKAALAAPARECDVGTPAEQAQRMANFCKRHYKKAVPGRHICSACKFHNKDVEWECYFAWAQMPYRESGVSK